MANKIQIKRGLKASLPWGIRVLYRHERAFHWNNSGKRRHYCSLAIIESFKIMYPLSQ